MNVQDDSTSCRPLSIITNDGDFDMNLHRKGNIVYFNYNKTTQKELEYFPHIHLISEMFLAQWRFILFYFTFIGGGSWKGAENWISEICKKIPQAPDYDSVLDGGNNATNIFSLYGFNRTISSTIIQPVPEDKSTEDHKNTELLQYVNEESGKYNVKDSPNFKSKEWHTDTSP